jgi:hypothetical protein
MTKALMLALDFATKCDHHVLTGYLLPILLKYLQIQQNTLQTSERYHTRHNHVGLENNPPIYRPLSGIGISDGIFFSLLCDFNPELWQVHSTILAYSCLILGFG